MRKRRNSIERRVLSQRNGRQIQQPRGNYTSAPPNFGDIGEVEVVAVVFGMAQRRRFSIGGVVQLTNVRVMQYVESFGICSHQTVLNSVMHHLHKMTGTSGAAMQITLKGGARITRAA